MQMDVDKVNIQGDNILYPSHVWYQILFHLHFVHILHVGGNSWKNMIVIELG
jgi:hypothetical protein